MKELLQYILAEITSNPDAIVIEEKQENDETVYEVSVDEEDKGVVIGKGGMNIKAIRNIVSIVARRENKRVYIKVID